MAKNKRAKKSEKLTLTSEETKGTRAGYLEDGLSGPAVQPSFPGGGTLGDILRGIGDGAGGGPWYPQNAAD